MERGKMAIDHAAGQTDGTSEASATPSPGGRDFATQFMVYALFWGIIGAVLSSRIPLAVGAILFFSNDDFIAWVLRKVGIRLVPDSFGANFINAFVFLTGMGALLVYCGASLPAWLSATVPVHFSWAMVGVGALGCAALAGVVTAITGKLLPRIGMSPGSDSVAGALIRGVVGFAILGLLFLALSTLD